MTTKEGPMQRRIIPVAIALASLAAAPVARAGITDELKASDEVERVLEKRDKHLSYVANCRQISSRRFTCTWIGSSSSGSFATGRASVTKMSRYKFKARITSFHRS